MPRGYGVRMNGVDVMWIVVAFAAGTVFGALLLRRRHRQEVMARTLVPHRTREVLSAMQSGAVVVRRDRRAAFANAAAAALAVARLDGKLQPEVADLAEEAWERLLFCAGFPEIPQYDIKSVATNQTLVATSTK